MTRFFRHVAPALLAVLALSGLVTAQTSSLDSAAPMDFDCTLAVNTTPSHYSIQLDGGFPSNYAFMFLSPFAGSWTLDLGAPFGVVKGLEVMMPISFMMGIADGTGHIAGQIRKPYSIPPELVGTVWYAQAVSMMYNVGGVVPSYAFTFKTSNVAAFLMNPQGI